MIISEKWDFDRNTAPFRAVHKRRLMIKIGREGQEIKTKQQFVWVNKVMQGGVKKYWRHLNIQFPFKHCHLKI